MVLSTVYNSNPYFEILKSAFGVRHLPSFRIPPACRRQVLRTLYLVLGTLYKVLDTYYLILATLFASSQYTSISAKLISLKFFPAALAARSRY